MFLGDSYTLAGVVAISKSDSDPAFWRGLDWVFIKWFFAFARLIKTANQARTYQSAGFSRYGTTKNEAAEQSKCPATSDQPLKTAAVGFDIVYPRPCCRANSKGVFS